MQHQADIVSITYEVTSNRLIVNSTFMGRGSQLVIKKVTIKALYNGVSLSGFISVANVQEDGSIDGAKIFKG